PVWPPSTSAGITSSTISPGCSSDGQRSHSEHGPPETGREDLSDCRAPPTAPLPSRYSTAAANPKHRPPPSGGGPGDDRVVVPAEADVPARQAVLEMAYRSPALTAPRGGTRWLFTVLISAFSFGLYSLATKLPSVKG